MHRNRFPRAMGRAGLVCLALTTLAACAGTGVAPTWTYPPAPVAPAAAARAAAPAAAGMLAMAAVPGTANAPAAPAEISPAVKTGGSVASRLDLTIVTGDMIGKTEFPAFVPSDFTLPANSTIIVTITNFDDATPLAKGTEAYAKVSGTLDNLAAVTPIKVTDPNGAGGATTSIGSLPPAAVSHTFTIAALGINVPIAAHARTTFTIHTGAPGTYSWRCFDPCGAGTAGWGTAMAAMRGYMEGTLTVA